MAVDTRSVETGIIPDGGPYFAKIVSHLDGDYMGKLQVEILRNVGNMPTRTGQLTWAEYLSPFYGVTSFEHTGENDDYNDTQKSYGFWMVPPDVGTMVLVVLVEGRAFWIGCVQDQFMNFMVPGIAATDNNTYGQRVPVAEYNKQLNDMQQPDTTKVVKPVHVFAEVLSNQGLLSDEFRGTTTSSARREVPSMVFGVSTPGPVDRRPGAKRGKVGKYETKVSDAFVSRLGGSTFVMDDGDPNLLRKGPASDTPPEYANVADGETGGDPTIPHNELIRIRTRTGHQILMHNSEDFIYIVNAKGSTWIELTSNGKVDIYAADSISMHTLGDFNITADNDINLTAGNDINLVSGNNFKATAGVNYEILAGVDGKLTVGRQSNISAGKNHVETAANIHMNNERIKAEEATSAVLAYRVPMAEPWIGHENFQEQHPQTTPDPFRKVGK